MSPEHCDNRIVWDRQGQKTQEGQLTSREAGLIRDRKDPEVPTDSSIDESVKARGGRRPRKDAGWVAES